ncbi:MAG TPA: T9SS type B sorting domain-containing protein [Bacteroidetes bacterium]|nr:T9SS type B sorting domain-containing protein [Bacteroidota bacterium]
MKVHLPQKISERFPCLPRRSVFLFILLAIFVGKDSSLWAEGSKDFVNYDGYRMFLDTRDPQQLKVYANVGETINVGSSHVGIQGGFINVYDPQGNLVATFDNTNNSTGNTTGLAIINNSDEERDNPDGSINYTPGTITVPAGKAGIWTVIFDYPSYSNAGFTNILNNAPWTRAADQPNTRRVVLAWDITVESGGAFLKGRVYSNEHISLLNGNSTPSSPINTSPKFYVITEDGFQYRVNIMEADPFRFPISSNSLGLVDSQRNPIYLSKPEADFIRSDDTTGWAATNNLYLYEPQAEDVGALINNKIFFNPPNADLPLTAPVTDIYRSNTHTTWLLDQLEILVIDTLFLSGVSNGGTPCNPGTLEFEKGGVFNFQTNLGGVVTLQLDLNNNGIFTDPVDVTIVQAINEGMGEVFWDGNDGLGNPIPVQNDFTFNYQGDIRFGELHIALTDVEASLGGVTFDWLNAPAGFPTDQFYYDHSEIDPNTSVSVSSPSGMGGMAGNPQATTHPYTYPLFEGNDDYIDQWFFIEQPIDPGSFTVNIVLDCSCDANDTPNLTVNGADVCAGDAISLTASSSTPGLSDLNYSWSGPDSYSFSEQVAATATSTANVTNSATSANTGTYQVIATTSALCADTASIAVFVSPTPILQTNQNSASVCVGDNAQFCATNSAGGSGLMTCTWQGPNGFFQENMVDVADQVCVDLTNVALAGSGDYTLVCSLNGCESDPLTFTLSVEPTPEINGISPNGDFCVGDNVVLTATNNVAGTGPITYTWTGPNFSFTGTSADFSGPFEAPINNIQLDNAGQYTLNIETQAGCAAVAQSINIGVNPLPEVCNVTGGGDACIGQSVALSAENCATGLTGPISFVWKNPLGVEICSGTVASGPFECTIDNIQLADSGDYTIELTDDGTGCTTAPFAVNVNVVNGLIITNVTPDADYCEGEDVILTATNTVNAGTISYVWTFENNVILCQMNNVPWDTPLTCTISSIEAVDAGNYTLTVTSEAGCMADPVVVAVGFLDGVTIDAVTGGGSYCEGEMIELSGSSTSNSAMVGYEWTDPNGMSVGSGNTPPAGPFDATLNPPVVSGTYTLTVTSEGGCTDTETVTIDFGPTPVAEIIIDGNVFIGGDTTLCNLDTLEICGRNTNPDVTDFIYTWSTPTGQTITGTGSGTDIFCDTISPMITFGAGEYGLVISANGCNSDEVIFMVNLNPNPVISTITGGGTYCEGDTAVICFSNTNPEVADWFYTCNFGADQVTGTGTGTNEICLEITEPGFIFCSLESDLGCVSSLDGVEIIFETNFTPDVSSNSPVCANETLELNGSNSSSCTGNVTYTWTGPGGFTFSDTAPCTGPFPASVTSPVSGQYCLELAGGGACAEMACVDVVVNELPFVTGGGIDGGGDFCVGDMTTLSATIENPSGGDIDYEWTMDGTVVASGTEPSGTMISLDLGTMEEDDSGEYCLNLTCVATGCSDTGLGCTTVTVNETPVLEMVSGSGTYCQDFDVMLNGSGPTCNGDVTYTWTGPNGFSFMGSAPCGGPYPATIANIDVDQAGVYTLQLFKGDCASQTMDVAIEVNPTPDIINVSDDIDECAGTMTDLAFTIDPDGAASVDWMITGPGLTESGTVTDLTDFTFPIEVNSMTAGTYTITAVSDQGCEAVPQTIQVSEMQPPMPSLTADPNPPCPGETMVLMTNGIAGATYNWLLDGVSIGTTTDPSFSVTNPASGAYSVEVTDPGGCSGTSDPLNISLPVTPVANDDQFTTDPEVPVSGNILSNDNTSTGVSATVVTPPTNGTVTVDASGNMVYTPNAGFSGTDQFTYEICLIDCPTECDQAVVTITINTPLCEVPNVITPNGDGVNDMLEIGCVPGFPNNQLRLFNRWGDEIVVFAPYDNLWDGTYGDSKDPVPAGTYYYLFWEDKNNSDDFKAGYIKVIR